jgi:hypothetical protein
MRSRSCRGTSLGEPAPFNTILNVFTGLPCQKKSIEILASFQVTLKMKIIPCRRIYIHMHMTFTRAASLEDEEYFNTGLEVLAQYVYPYS